MSALRFCLLTTFYPPYSFGGDGIDVQRMARALVRRGHHVTVVHDIDAYQRLARKPLASPPPADDGIEIVGLRSRLGLFSLLMTHQLGRPVMHSRRLKRLVRDRVFDVVVFNNISLLGGPGLLSFGGDALKVYVAHEHWLVCPTHVLWRLNKEACQERTCVRCVLSYRRPPQLWRYTGWLERQLAEVDVFIARSEFSRRKHHELGFPRPMRVLPYFLPGVVPDAPERPSERPQSRPYLLFVGRLTRLKGLDSVIPAFREYPDADLLIVGTGEDAERLQALAGGLPNVKFLGPIANEDLGRYYKHAIAAITPSLGYETFGIVLIEAFRHCTPVIARRQGPFPEIIEQSGGGVLFSDQRELLAGMKRLQQDPEYRGKLGCQAFRACRERWSEDVVVGRFLELLSESFAARALTRVGARAAQESLG